MGAPAKYMFTDDFARPSDRKPSMELAEHAAKVREAETAAFARGFAAASAEAKTAGAAPSTPAPRREVAVTFVNFPGYADDPRVLPNMMRMLLGSLKAHDVRDVGFVNEGMLYREGGAENEVRVAALREWVAAGHELGNETAHHTDLYKTAVEDFKADVLSGDKLLSKLAAERAIRSRPSMAEEQREMIGRLVAGHDGVAVVVGQAGTWKTYALAAAAEAWESMGRDVVGAALARRARVSPAGRRPPPRARARPRASPG